MSNVFLLLLNIKGDTVLFQSINWNFIFIEDLKELASKVAYFQQNWFSRQTIHWALPKCNSFVKCFILIVSCIKHLAFEWHEFSLKTHTHARTHPPTHTHINTYFMFQFMQMEESAYLFCMHQEMIRWGMRAVLSGGLQCRV